MTLDDLEEVQAIDRSSFPKPWPEDAFRYELTKNRNSSCWVAEYLDPEEGAKLAGSIVIWQVVDEAHIATLAVRESCRRLGVGRRLLARALLECVQQGAKTALLEVRAGNAAAQNLYQRFGFEAVGLRPGYYQDNKEDAILMTLDPLDEAHLAALTEPGKDQHGSTHQTGGQP
jgi:ribosomal-protein-alanine N-acetyltransferase